MAYNAYLNRSQEEDWSGWEDPDWYESPTKGRYMAAQQRWREQPSSGYSADAHLSAIQSRIDDEFSSARHSSHDAHRAPQWNDGPSSNKIHYNESGASKPFSFDTWALQVREHPSDDQSRIDNEPPIQSPCPFDVPRAFQGKARASSNRNDLDNEPISPRPFQGNAQLARSQSRYDTYENPSSKPYSFDTHWASQGHARTSGNQNRFDDASQSLKTSSVDAHWAPRANASSRGPVTRIDRDGPGQRPSSFDALQGFQGNSCPRGNPSHIDNELMMPSPRSYDRAPKSNHRHVDASHSGNQIPFDNELPSQGIRSFRSPQAHGSAYPSEDYSCGFAELPSQALSPFRPPKPPQGSTYPSDNYSRAYAEPPSQALSSLRPLQPPQGSANPSGNHSHDYAEPPSQALSSFKAPQPPQGSEYPSGNHSFGYAEPPIQVPSSFRPPRPPQGSEYPRGNHSHDYAEPPRQALSSFKPRPPPQGPPYPSGNHNGGYAEPPSQVTSSFRPAQHPQRSEYPSGNCSRDYAEPPSQALSSFKPPQPSQGSEYPSGNRIRDFAEPPSQALSSFRPLQSPQASAYPSDNHTGSRVYSEPPKAKPCSFDALRALQGPDSDDEGSTQAGSSRHPHSERSGPGSPAKTISDSSDDEKSKAATQAELVGKSATLAERTEAEEVVKNAFRDVKERDMMRSKVSSSSPADLQAMLNARLKR